ncbi:hypothetical protein SMACR_04452 [Sordaria macrospora]|uniref:WGS project CABT00000000 data, contig 2.14 n=2 Tax=Sordaria macrospora TaxID=5147 RepID=F7VYW3_SORMK|nr:uncharacterized protein SMAC_04452 [Sordaria macrospora k-hell]KAA8634520.1 hypothetical protein SMACR_04452 [Sordaria macrospora]KAH7633701.1 hypothetical protein B0T09DRAFT_381138 [Sordaria sp. MPI-SDFR-AT-0083]WPJ59919.1 hypothetical protein SMAC4_04452 [Sordaria macrospora]CCC10709.1 unnamed protein product [Sordaria macrospora k-hell]
MAPSSMLNTLTILLSATAALFTAGADATPLPSSNTGTKAKTCVNGPPATGSSPGSLPIADYSLVAPAGNLNWTSYTVKKSWWDEHYLSGPHYMPYSHHTDPYGAFKCQYTCNAAGDKCKSYFLWYTDVNGSNEHINCVLFDDIIDQSIFVPGTNATIGAGGYDRRCQGSA